MCDTNDSNSYLGRVKMYQFSFLCDCNPNTIIWVNRMGVTKDCTVVFSGVCHTCGKTYSNLQLKATDVIKLAAEAEDTKKDLD